MDYKWKTDLPLGVSPSFAETPAAVLAAEGEPLGGLGGHSQILRGGTLLCLHLFNKE